MGTSHSALASAVVDRLALAGAVVAASTALFGAQPATALVIAGGVIAARAGIPAGVAVARRRAWIHRARWTVPWVVAATVGAGAAMLGLRSDAITALTAAAFATAVAVSPRFPPWLRVLAVGIVSAGCALRSGADVRLGFAIGCIIAATGGLLADARWVRRAPPSGPVLRRAPRHGAR